MDPAGKGQFAMSHVAFARRQDLVASLHAKVQGATTQIEATESEIRSVQYEQALRSDPAQTRQNNYPHPKSKKGRDMIKACRDRIKGLQRRRSRLFKERDQLRNEVRFQESIVSSATDRPLRDKRPMRKL
jgi:hypothetical protein